MPFSGRVARWFTGSSRPPVGTSALDMAKRISTRSRFGLKLAKQSVNQAQDAQGYWTAQQAAMSLQQIATLRSSRARHRVHQFAVRALIRFPQTPQAREFAEKVRATIPAVQPGAGRARGARNHAMDGPRTPAHL